MTEAPLSWSFKPNKAPYYINTVALSAGGEKVITGTFFHQYSRRKASKPAVSEKLGSYCLDASGALLWKDEFTNYEGVYWAAITPAADFAATCGWYSNNPYQGFVFIYDANTGQRLVSYTDTPHRVSVCAFSGSANVLAAAGSSVMVFRQSGASYESEPLVVDLPASSPSDPDSAQGLAIDVTGRWIAVGTYQGNIHLIDTADGKATIVASYNSGESVHAVSMDWGGSTFIAGASGGHLYHFTTEDFLSTSQPDWRVLLSSGGICAESVYGVALSEDGSTATAVGNIGQGGQLGLLKINSDGGQWQWFSATAHNPNSTSMTGSGNFLTVADGHPDGTPGEFYYYSAESNTPLWTYPTSNMSWPMQIASGGQAAVAGSDDGHVYYFAPLS